jgi:hypothetical protein
MDVSDRRPALRAVNCRLAETSDYGNLARPDLQQPKDALAHRARLQWNRAGAPAAPHYGVGFRAAKVGAEVPERAHSIGK